MTAAASAAPALSVRDLRVYYHVPGVIPRRHWVAGPVSFAIAPGECLGLAGPSGCGKTSVGKAVLNLLPTWHGDVHVHGEDIRHMPRRQLRGATGWVSQEPMLAFSPRRRVLDTIRETLAVHARAAEGQTTVPALCASLRLPLELLHRYPFELSAGQMQRMVVLRVCMLRPRFVVLDEPTSSLDALNQREILEWLGQWRREHGASALVIAHAHAVLHTLCDRTIEMDASDVRVGRP